MKAHNSGETGIYLPNLLIIPSNLVDQYISEFRKSFKGSLRLSIWYGSPGFNQSDIGNNEGFYIGQSIEDFREWYNSVPTTDPRNCERILLTTYRTFQSRARDQTNECLLAELK